MRPFETAESVWPARPTRCSPRATDLGDSIWITRSTAPMSIPSSSELVATRQRSSPRLQLLLDLGARLARERAVVGARDLLLGEVVQPQREPLGEAAVVDEHDRRRVLLDQLEHARIDARPDRAPAGRVAALGDGVDRRRAGLGLRIAQVGDRHDHLEVERLVGRRPRRSSPAAACPRAAPCRPGTARSPRSGAGWPTGRCAGDGRRLAAVRRGIAAPRAARGSATGASRACSPATAWISSRITHSTSASVSRAREVSIR